MLHVLSHHYEVQVIHLDLPVESMTEKSEEGHCVVEFHMWRKERAGAEAAVSAS